MSRLNQILLAPHLSEKSLDVKRADNVHVFRCRPDANKIEIKQAVEAHFGVKVLKVRTLNVRPVDRRVGKYLGKTSSWKKAYVTVERESGQIEYFEGT